MTCDQQQGMTEWRQLWSSSYPVSSSVIFTTPCLRSQPQDERTLVSATSFTRYVGSHYHNLQTICREEKCCNTAELWQDISWASFPQIIVHFTLSVLVQLIIQCGLKIFYFSLNILSHISRQYYQDTLYYSHHRVTEQIIEKSWSCFSITFCFILNSDNCLMIFSTNFKLSQSDWHPHTHSLRPTF